MMALAKHTNDNALFGPTSSKKFSPKVKDNVKILDSKELYKTS